MLRSEDGAATVKRVRKTRRGAKMIFSGTYDQGRDMIKEGSISIEAMINAHPLVFFTGDGLQS